MYTEKTDLKRYTFSPEEIHVVCPIYLKETLGFLIYVKLEYNKKAPSGLVVKFPVPPVYTKVSLGK